MESNSDQSPSYNGGISSVSYQFLFSSALHKQNNNSFPLTSLFSYTAHNITKLQFSSAVKLWDLKWGTSVCLSGVCPRLTGSLRTVGLARLQLSLLSEFFSSLSLSLPSPSYLIVHLSRLIAWKMRSVKKETIFCTRIWATKLPSFLPLLSFGLRIPDEVGNPEDGGLAPFLPMGLI